MIKALLDEIASRGDRAAVVPVSRFEDLKREMEGLQSEAHHAFSDWMAGGMALPRDTRLRAARADLRPDAQPQGLAAL